MCVLLAALALLVLALVLILVFLASLTIGDFTLVLLVPLRDVDHVDNAPETASLHTLVDNHAAGYGTETQYALLARQSPDAEQVDDVGGSAQGQRVLSGAAEYDAATAGGADEVSDVTDEGGAAAGVGSQRLGVAHLEAYAAGDGGHAVLWAEVEGEVLAEVERDERDVEVDAGVLEALFGKGLDGDNVVGGDEGLQAERGRGRVAEGHGGAVEDAGELLVRGRDGRERRGGNGGDGQLEGVVKGDGGIAEGGGEGEELEELVWGRGGRPGHIEVVHDGGGAVVVTCREKRRVW